MCLLSGEIHTTSHDSASLLGLLKRQTVFTPVEHLKLRADFVYDIGCILYLLLLKNYCLIIAFHVCLIAFHFNQFSHNSRKN